MAPIMVKIGNMMKYVFWRYLYVRYFQHTQDGVDLTYVYEELDKKSIPMLVDGFKLLLFSIQLGMMKN